jgi:hypothetical protein
MIKFTISKETNPKKVNCTEPSPSFRAPWHRNKAGMDGVAN